MEEVALHYLRLYLQGAGWKRKTDLFECIHQGQDVFAVYEGLKDPLGLLVAKWINPHSSIYFTVLDRGVQSVSVVYSSLPIHALHNRRDIKKPYFVYGQLSEGGMFEAYINTQLAKGLHMDMGMSSTWSSFAAHAKNARQAMFRLYRTWSSIQDLERSTLSPSLSTGWIPFQFRAPSSLFATLRHHTSSLLTNTCSLCTEKKKKVAEECVHAEKSQRPLESFGVQIQYQWRPNEKIPDHTHIPISSSIPAFFPRHSSQSEGYMSAGYFSERHLISFRGLYRWVMSWPWKTLWPACWSWILYGRDELSIGAEYSHSLQKKASGFAVAFAHEHLFSKQDENDAFLHPSIPQMHSVLTVCPLIGQLSWSSNVTIPLQTDSVFLPSLWMNRLHDWLCSSLQQSPWTKLEKWMGLGKHAFHTVAQVHISIATVTAHKLSTILRSRPQPEEVGDPSRSPISNSPQDLNNTLEIVPEPLVSSSTARFVRVSAQADHNLLSYDRDWSIGLEYSAPYSPIIRSPKKSKEKDLLTVPIVIYERGIHSPTSICQPTGVTASLLPWMDRYRMCFRWNEGYAMLVEKRWTKRLCLTGGVLVKNRSTLTTPRELDEPVQTGLIQSLLAPLSWMSGATWTFAFVVDG